MHACGLVVEYNPFHHGHQYHLQMAKKQTNADCMIAVMSGNFLQRGEPAITDKFSRTKMAIDQGVDIVVELPYSSTVQHSDLFSQGAVEILNEMLVSSICFGSENGDITAFKRVFDQYKDNQNLFNKTLKHELSLGKSFPNANNKAFAKIGLDEIDKLDLMQANNILGFGYIKAIEKINPSIQPFTIQRKQSNYHDEHITTPLASATSIRNALFSSEEMSETMKETISQNSLNHLIHYKQKAGTWHTWDEYFSLLQYRVLTMSKEELKNIQGVDEGIENRIIRTAKEATTFSEWMQELKTKRYTQTRLQRIFTHILTHTTKQSIKKMQQMPVPYIRLLGLSEQGKLYLNSTKKDRTVPLLTQFKNQTSLMMSTEERATDAYYAILPPKIRKEMRKQELEAPYQKQG
ncbi:nucleotidyltransferase [Paraliobacillus salinarum]|uniref:nucleotidyltransferase n=1 Tax=Paraliobacillus salinarum TaxID=1158996 RepID=UPI0015F6273A|nr:nucleotidyltransferase [Paraliobacillus salinarum]